MKGLAGPSWKSKQGCWGASRATCYLQNFSSAICCHVFKCTGKEPAGWRTCRRSISGTMISKTLPTPSAFQRHLLKSLDCLSVRTLFCCGWGGGGRRSFNTNEITSTKFIGYGMFCFLCLHVCLCVYMHVYTHESVCICVCAGLCAVQKEIKRTILLNLTGKWFSWTSDFLPIDSWNHRPTKNYTRWVEYTKFSPEVNY